MKIGSLLIISLLAATTSAVFAQEKVKSILGAWETGTPEYRSTMICSDKYFSIAVYDLKNKRFIGTYGGSYSLQGEGYSGKIEFHTLNPETVGTDVAGSLRMQNGKLAIEEDGQVRQWEQVDDGTPGKLAGAWLITGRVRDGAMSKITPGARRTMKILSGTRFQWIAYNAQTGEFSGTGGGTYDTRDGKYTEHIEFFSRDNSRVGADLTFDFAIENEGWRHKGLSSKGDPIDEIWTKREKIGL